MTITAFAQQRAVLECAADAVIGRLAAIAFRTATIEGWTLSNGTLYLHVAEGSAPPVIAIAPVRKPWSELHPGKIDTGRFTDTPVLPYPHDWVRITLKPEQVGPHGIALKIPRGVRFDERETVRFAPYLTVETSR